MLSVTRWLRRLLLTTTMLLAIPAFSKAVPVVELNSSDPGLNGVYPFMGPDGFGNTYFAYPTQWGGFITGTGLVQAGDGRLTNDADGAFVRYNTTMQGENPAAGQYTKTAMSPAKDWVLSMDWESNMTATAGTVFELSVALDDVARLRANGAGYYELQAGDGSSGYSVVKAFAPATVLFPNTIHNLMLHYKASNQLMDFYVDGTLQAANFPARGTSPNYAAEFLQLGGGRFVDPGNPSPVDIYQNVKIGILAATAVPGDFDSDGDVDGADFVAWQTNFPKASDATLSQGDADSDGDVDGADFVVWQTNFPFPPGPGVTSVPEPQSLCVFVIGSAVVLLLRRRGLRNGEIEHLKRECRYQISS
jgi:hypothetical protein